MTHWTDSESFATRFGQIEKWLQQIEQSSDTVASEAARELVQSLLDLHSIGLRRFLQILAKQDGGGRVTIEACLQDELVRCLLLLHDLHPQSLEERVQQALEKVRPYLKSHGGNVELLELSPSGLLIRLEGSCHGCPSSAATLRGTIEQAIYEYAPDAGPIRVAGESETTGEFQEVAADPKHLVPLQLLRDDDDERTPQRRRRPRRHEHPLAEQES